MYSVPQHFSLRHNKNIQDLKVFAIKVMPSHLIDKENLLKLCKQETFRIYRLDTLGPKGLNEDLDVYTVL